MVVPVVSRRGSGAPPIRVVPAEVVLGLRSASPVEIPGVPPRPDNWAELRARYNGGVVLLFLFPGRLCVWGADDSDLLVRHCGAMAFTGPDGERAASLPAGSVAEMESCVRRLVVELGHRVALCERDSDVR